MNLLKYKGKHIRVSDKSLVFRFSAGSLFLLFLAVIMLLNLKSILTTDWKSVSFLQDGNVHLVVTPYRIRSDRTMDQRQKLVQRKELPHCMSDQ